MCLPIIPVYKWRLRGQKKNSNIRMVRNQNDKSPTQLIMQSLRNKENFLSKRKNILLLHQTHQEYQMKTQGKICKTSFSQMQSWSPHSFLLLPSSGLPLPERRNNLTSVNSKTRMTTTSYYLNILPLDLLFLLLELSP